MNIKNFLNLYMPDDELEIRMGYYTLDGMFRSEINSFMFHYMINIMSKSGMERKVYYQKIKRRNGYRMIEEDNNISVSLKEKKSILDYKSLGLRTALSKEKNVNKDINFFDSPDTQNIDRVRISFNSESYKIELTKDIETKYQKTFIKYQCELEFNYKPSYEIYTQIFNWMKDTYTIMKDNQKIIIEYNNFFQDYMKKSKRNKYIPYTGGSKPVNIKRTNFPALNEYYIGIKPDGVSYFIYFASDYIAMINDTNIIIKNNPFNVKYTIILAELMEKDNIIAYDILIDNEINVTNNNFLNRMSRLEKTISLLNNQKYQMVEYLPISEKNARSILSLDIPNDGIIFKHGLSKFGDRGIYKWKPPNDNTIDFLCKDGDLYYNSKSGLEKFQGTPSFPYIQKVENVENNMIYEFRYDYNTKNFIVLRERKDKLVPNFQTTVFSIWEDIENPITDKLLYKYINTILDKEKKLSYNIKSVCNYLHIEKNNMEIFNICKVILKTKGFVISKLFETICYISDQNNIRSELSYNILNFFREKKDN